MKKLIVTTASLIIGAFLFLSAQNQTDTLSHKFKPGWFIGANGGMNWFAGEGNNFIRPNAYNGFSFVKSSGYTGRLALGYQFNPVYSVRGMIGYNQYNHNRPVLNSPDINFPFNGETLQGDVIMNLTNKNLGYDANRKLDFSAFAGLGLAYQNKNVINTPIAGMLRGGVQGDYHFNRYLAANLMFELNLTTDNYNDLVESLPVDMTGGLFLGLNYILHELPKREKPAPKPIVEKPTVTEPVTPPVVEPAAIAETKRDTVVAPVVTPVVPEKPAVAVRDTVKPVKETPVVVPPVVPVTTVTPPAALLASALNEKIFFTINRASIVNKQQTASIATIVDYMKLHPDATVTVSGYADASTGTVAANNAMSKRRAVSVANTLIKKYGIPYDHINLKWYGGGVQPYLKAAKNRLVIVKSPVNAPVVSTTPVPAAPVVTPAEPVKTTPAVATDEKDLYAVVNFAESKSDIVNTLQEEAIKKAGLFLQRNPDAMVRVSGYADKVYGAPDYNNVLSKKRATSVANELINKYGVKYDRIQVKWFGGTNKHSATPSMNRLVLIETIK